VLGVLTIDVIQPPGVFTHDRNKEQKEKDVAQTKEKEAAQANKQFEPVCCPVLVC
jgi:hypothetical protein